MNISEFSSQAVNNANNQQSNTCQIQQSEKSTKVIEKNYRKRYNRKIE